MSPTPVSSVGPASCGDANLASYLRHVAHTSDGGSVSERPGITLFAGAHNYPGAYTNGVIRTADPTVASPANVLEAAQAFFRPLRRGYAVWVRTHADADLEAACLDAGMWIRPPEIGLPGVAIDRAIEMPSYDSDVRMERIVDDQGRRDYLHVVSAGWNVDAMPVPLQEKVLFSLASLDSPQVAVYVAYLDDQPASGCMTYVSDGCAGLYWASTLPSARGKGLAKATFAAACRDGFDMGAQVATAQASAVGAPIWQRLGFEVVTHYKRYLAKPPS